MSHLFLLPCCGLASVAAQLVSQFATFSGNKCSSPASGPHCREQGRRVELQDPVQGYLAGWEEGLVKLAHPLTFTKVWEWAS